MRIGGIEAGGTKFVCGCGTTDGTIEHMTSFATGNPIETCQQVIDYFTKHPVDAIGIGAFGPVDVKSTAKLWDDFRDTQNSLAPVPFPLYLKTSPWAPDEA
ncbi:hypothetical protein ACEQPO_01095 [Bacillus sp. SL00103]